jgi:hypothetical protein
MKGYKFYLAVAVLLLLAVPSFGQAVSNTATTPINVTRGESISISVSTALPTMTIPTGSLNSEIENVVVQSSWNLKPARTNGVQICVFAVGALTGSTGNADTIPVNNVYVTPSGGSATALGGATVYCGIAGGVQFKVYPTTTAAQRKDLAGQSDTIPVQVKLAADVTADTYTGTLNLTAYTN